MRKSGIVIGAVATALLLTGCGGGGKKADANASPSDPPSTTAAPATPAGGTEPTGAPTGGPATKPGGKTPDGPMVGPGSKCGAVSVKAGRISCGHALKVFNLYAQKKTATGTAAFSGWTCRHTAAPKGTSCTRSGVTLHSAE
ncbi:hypothetical protein [Actinomadura harenae]|uniref:Uncharacterized protein n=1 Tax=Actinomadura harenae TaxID=2483351 RepID=A0A3M2M235_9ACTN|nr:hypothetical protein [Actinomadura harenae]RMI43130.1 hypothetical protein EBO15_16945 [Actinomadura harenae]